MTALARLSRRMGTWHRRADLNRRFPLGSMPTDIRAITDYFDEVIDLSEDAERRLRRLTPPPELAGKADELLALAEEQLALAREARDAAKRRDEDRFHEIISSQRAGSLAAREESLNNELGLTECQ